MKFLSLDENVNVGNHEITVNDLAHLDRADAQLQEALALSFGHQSAGGVIIAGVAQTVANSQISYSRGYLARAGQLWRVKELLPQPIAASKKVFAIYKIENTYPAVTYKSGQSFHVHQERVVELVYRDASNPPAGQHLQDYAILDSDVHVERVDDIVQRVAANTAQRAIVEAEWTTLSNSLMSGMRISGLVGFGTGSQCRYKVIGRQLFLELLLTHPDTAQDQPSIVLQPPNGYVIAPNTDFVLIAYDSQNGTCPVAMKAANPTFPNGRIVFERAPQTTGTIMHLSFSVILEIII